MQAPLPPPRTTGGIRLNEAIAARRSTRDFAPEQLRTEELSQLLWAAQGITGPRDERATPSAGGLYPLVLHVLDAGGVHRYVPSSHALEQLSDVDCRRQLAGACLDQLFVGAAPVALVFGSMRRRARARYGVRADRYAMIEAGHAAQNVLLQAAALGLAAVPVGAFYDDEVNRQAQLGDRVDALYVLPVGQPAS